MPPASKTLPIKVSNPEKVFWPEEGYTKLDLVTFYRDVFPALRPYVNDRILTLERCPDGMGGACFYQKQKPESMPAGTPIKRIANDRGSSSRKATDYVVGGSLATQLALANLGCIPVHVSGSRAKTFPKPDWVALTWILSRESSQMPQRPVCLRRPCWMISTLFLFRRRPAAVGCISSSQSS
jgi:DNA primase